MRQLIIRRCSSAFNINPTSRDNAFNVEEELLSLISLHNTTKGADIYRAMEISVNPIGGFSKLSSVCTDGAPSMRGGKEGLRGQFNKNNEEVPFYHCIIHQPKRWKNKNN